MVSRTACLLLGLALLSSLPAAAAAPEFKVDARHITVRTDRYLAEFDGLTLTRLENRLTGEVYAQAAAATGAARGVGIESLRPGVPTRTFGLAERTQVASAEIPDGIAVTYTGLQAGEDFDAGLTLVLKLTVDAKTGDLLVEPNVHAEIEEVAGARDRGVLHAAVGFGSLTEDLRLIIPASDGFSVTKDKVQGDWAYHARWPQFWEAALLIAESPKGCLGIWADEPELRYGRWLDIKRKQGWHVTLAFETADVIYRCTEMKGATWRLNVFNGYWANAAARYVAQMEAQWPDLQRLEKTTPAWADKIRIFITGPTPNPENAKRYTELVPRDTLAVFTCQEWLRGWNEGDIKNMNKGMDYFPNYPFDNPTHYEARPDMPAKFKACEELGIHIFPYTNPTIVTWGHPWIQKKVGPRGFMAYKFWQRMHPELCQDLIKRYGVSAIYEDCSWVVARHPLGEPDGDNWYNGSVHMRQYFRKLLPEIAICGERNNEVTFRGQKFALSITQWGGHAHPINAYIFGPFLRMWNLQLGPAGFDADDIRGWMTPWPFGFEENPIQERLLLRKRGIVFAKEQLKSYWPETWDPAVMHYFKAADGTEYRFVRDHGTRFVKLAPAGPETIYWRLHGVTDAEVGKGGVEGWLAYDKDRIIGLNPKAVYILLDEVKRPAVTISELPEDCVIARGVIRDGFWLATFARADGKAGTQQVTVKVRSTQTKPVQFGGATAVKELSKGEYEIKLSVPGGLVAYWQAPVDLSHNDRLNQYPAMQTIHRRDTGLISQYGGKVDQGDNFAQNCGDAGSGEEGTAAWLVKVPEFGATGDDRTCLVFKYGSGHPYGDGANYMVRVNGKQVWKRYRLEAGKPDPQKPGEPQSVPLGLGAADLSRFAGKVIVLELATDGNHSSVSESIRWHQPTIAEEAPAQAETDDGPKGPPTGPEADPLDLQ